VSGAQQTIRESVIGMLNDALEEIVPLKDDEFSWGRIEKGNALDHAERKIRASIERLTPRDNPH
jgi:hypothetical protein